MNRTASLVVLFGLSAPWIAACGGDDDGTVPAEIQPAAKYAAKCAMPRSGTDQFTGDKFVDTKGSLLDEQLWLRSWIDDLYLWYSEVPVNDPKKYTTALDYFDVLKTPATTTSGKAKDQFHFTYDTAVWEGLSGAGTEASYGLTWSLVKNTPPRKLVVAFTNPDSPAAKAGMLRGTEVVTIDGVDVANGSDVDTLNNGISPSDINQTHTFVVRDPGATDTHTIMMTSANVSVQPVQDVDLLSITGSTDKVGYILFTDHIATAEKGLFDAITSLKAKGATDLILDLRYNGGGYLDIAAELAYMIAGPTSNGMVFERESYNDKHQQVDPLTGMALQPTPFINISLGFTQDFKGNQPLPTLDLPIKRVYILTSSGTCSASEAVMNGLAGVGVDVIQIGNTTCGKPYGFFPADNCGTTYFAIQFQGVNAMSFGDYADGFVPGGHFKGCAASDDFAHPLANENEGMIAAALAYRATGICPIAAAPAVQDRATGERRADSLADPKPLWRQNRIITTHR